MTNWEKVLATAESLRGTFRVQLDLERVVLCDDSGTDTLFWRKDESGKSFWKRRTRNEKWQVTPRLDKSISDCFPINSVTF